MSIFTSSSYLNRNSELLQNQVILSDAQTPNGTCSWDLGFNDLHNPFISSPRTSRTMYNNVIDEGMDYAHLLPFSSLRDSSLAETSSLRCIPMHSANRTSILEEDVSEPCCCVSSGFMHRLGSF